jgi:hypothetical protein
LLSIIFSDFLAKLFLPLLVKVVEKSSENMQKQQQQAQDASWKKTQTRMRCFTIRLMPKILAKQKSG